MADKGWLIDITFPIFVPHNSQEGAGSEKEAIGLIKESVRSARWPNEKTPFTYTVKYVKG